MSKEATMTFCEYCTKTISETKALMIMFNDRSYYIDIARIKSINPAAFKRIANAKVVNVLETVYQSLVKLNISFDKNVEIQ